VTYVGSSWSQMPYDRAKAGVYETTEVIAGHGRGAIADMAGFNAILAGEALALIGQRCEFVERAQFIGDPELHDQLDFAQQPIVGRGRNRNE
jgi:hypothetical protein